MQKVKFTGSLRGFAQKKKKKEEVLLELWKADTNFIGCKWARSAGQAFSLNYRERRCP
jgi:hypothetical protein